MGEMGEETTNKSINTRNNHSESRSFRDNRYPCIWRCKLAWNISSSIHMQSYDSHLEQGLIGSKSGLSKKQLVIPRLDSVVAQIVANLAKHIRNSLMVT